MDVCNKLKDRAIALGVALAVPIASNVAMLGLGTGLATACVKLGAGIQLIVLLLIVTWITIRLVSLFLAGFFVGHVVSVHRVAYAVVSGIVATVGLTVSDTLGRHAVSPSAWAMPATKGVALIYLAVCAVQIGLAAVGGWVAGVRSRVT